MLFKYPVCVRIEYMQEEKFEKDVYYVEHMSLWLDVMILFKTVAVVLKREGINSETSATMEEFMGVPEEETVG